MADILWHDRCMPVLPSTQLSRWATLQLKRKGKIMLRAAIALFILAIVAGVLGFGGIAGGLASIAKICFIVFIVLAVLSILGHALTGRSPV